MLKENRINAKTGFTLSHLWNEAYRAHLDTSFSPDDRAHYYIKEYSELLDSDLDLIPIDKREDYKMRFISLFRAWMGAKSRCLSSMIAGPSKFPVRRAEKANISERNRSNEFTAWREKAIKRLTRPEPVEGISELDEAKANLEQRKHNHEFYKKVNKIIRSGGDVVSKLIGAGIKEDLAKSLIIPDRIHGSGFPSYKLSNNLAEIKRLEARIIMLSSKADKANDPTTAKEQKVLYGVTIVSNYPDDRVQLLFPSKPSDEVRAALKRRAFRWSPHNQAWQRKLTVAAIREAETIIEQYYSLTHNNQ